MKHGRRLVIAGLGWVAMAVALAWNAHGGQDSLATPAATIIYVDADAAEGGGGTSWADAYNDLQLALAAAGPGVEIWVTEGTYKPTDGSDHAMSFELKNDVAVYGGFTGTEDSRDQRDWETYVTVLSGDIDGNDTTDPHGVITDTANITGINSYHVVTSSGLTGTAILDGFTISGGHANGTDLHGHGGGMYNDNSSPTLTNLTFSGNRAHYDGGGMANYHNSNPALANVAFSNNSADDDGECNSHSSPALAKATLANVAFTSRTADWEGGGLYRTHRSLVLAPVAFTSETGGGMVNHNSSPTLTNVTFSGNCATWGGGMLNNYSSPTLTNVNFSDNLAFDQGGGMYNYPHCSPVLTNVTFSDNSAWLYGGGMYNSFSNPVLTGVAFTRNSSSYLGGGMGNWSSNPVLTNVAFTGNSADWDGGGMENHYSSPALTNVTFEGNSADRNGGGIFNVNSSPTLTNCILWGNAATSAGDQIYNDEDSTLIIRYSDVEGSNGSGGSWDTSLGTDGGGNIDTDPLFADAAGGELHLQLDSPAIDAGDNEAPGLAGVITDLGGHPRFADVVTVPDTGNGAPPIVDMGAYEAPPDVIFVDRTATGHNNGTSWDHAFTDLQGALAWALDTLSWALEEVEIWVAGSTYRPGTQREDTFQLVGGVALYGGFAGAETDRDQRDPITNQTVLSGDLNGDDGPGFASNEENSYHVVTGSGLTETAVLDGFTITGGNANGVESDGLGGGIYNSGSLSLAYVTVIGNYAHDGGGIASWGPMAISHSTISGNNADGAGGGIANWGLSLLANCTISHNSAGSFGGGVSNHGGHLTLSHCTITGNTADADADGNGRGGGIVSGFYADPRPGLVPVKNTIIAGNEPDTGSPASGPDIYEEYPAFESLGYNLIGNGEGATGFIDGVKDDQVGNSAAPLDPRLAALALNPPGTTETHALLPGSPALDWIPYGSNGCGSELNDDQRGVIRPAPAGGACDIGAYEVGPTVYLPLVLRGGS